MEIGGGEPAIKYNAVVERNAEPEDSTSNHYTLPLSSEIRIIPSQTLRACPLEHSFCNWQSRPVCQIGNRVSSRGVAPTTRTLMARMSCLLDTDHERES